MDITGKNDEIKEERATQPHPQQIQSSICPHPCQQPLNVHCKGPAAKTRCMQHCCAEVTGTVVHVVALRTASHATLQSGSILDICPSM